MNAKNRELSDESVKRKQAEEKIKHLNQALRAMRNVNQFIAKEKDTNKLLKRACGSFIETRGYYNVWIALLGESEKLINSAEAGLGKDFLPIVEQLERGELTRCAKKAIKQSEVIVTYDPPSRCTGCSLASIYSGRAAMTVRLEHDKEVFGILSISIPRQFTTKEECFLLEEIARDLAFALHNLKMEKEHRRAEVDREQYLQELELINDIVVMISREKNVDEICHLIGKAVHKVNQGSYVAVSLYDPNLGAIRIRTLIGFKKVAERLLKIVGGDPTKINIYPSEVEEKAAKLFTTGRLEYVPGGLYDLMTGKPSKGACWFAERLLGIEKAYTVGFALEDKPYGGISILAPKGQDVQYQSAIETIASHFSVVIQRKQAEEKLRQYSENLENIVRERTKKLKEAQEKLVRKEKLAVLGQLAGSVAHELRNPLGVISNAIYYLKMTYANTNDTIREYLNMISQEVGKSDKIISDLLNLSCTRPAEKNKVAISDLIASVLREHPAPEGIEVASNIPPRIPHQSLLIPSRYSKLLLTLSPMPTRL